MSNAILSTLLATIPGICHGFGTAAELIPRAFHSTWSSRPEKTQIHSAEIRLITRAGEPCGSADGFVSRLVGIPISVVHGDCIPVLLARSDGGMVAALHAGWRGIFAGIVESFGTVLAAMGETPSRWVAAVGPGIGPCCYEVAEELGVRFEARFPHIPAIIMQPAFRRLDLASIVNLELQSLGIGTEMITLSRRSLKSDPATRPVPAPATPHALVELDAHLLHFTLSPE
jgi:polyphenol oxidase